MPATHTPADLVPAVSCSSGHPILCPPPAAEYYGPGQAFRDPARDYRAAMDEFVGRSAVPPAERPPDPLAPAATQQRAARRQVRREMEEVQRGRRGERARRADIDRAWRGRRAARRAAQRAQAEVGGRARAGARRARRKTADLAAARAAAEEWRAARAARAADSAARAVDDAQWRTHWQELQAAFSGLGVVTVWIAVLVIIDSYSRRCVGLPVFVRGAHVTAAEVVAALRGRLPEEVEYVVSDRGVHFMAEVFARYLAAQEIVHVPVARHRPQSNGLAERFVRTFKEWVRDKTWATEAEFLALVAQFEAEYNARPHQGRGMGGLSPNERVRRAKLPLPFAA